MNDGTTNNLGQQVPVGQNPQGQQPAGQVPVGQTVYQGQPYVQGQQAVPVQQQYQVAQQPIQQQPMQQQPIQQPMQQPLQQQPTFPPQQVPAQQYSQQQYQTQATPRFYQPVANQQMSVSSSMNPEGGPAVQIRQEQGGGGQGGSKEFGYDSIKKIEQQVDQAERKEVKPVPTQQQQIPQQVVQQAQQVKVPVTEIPGSNPLKFFGYKISPVISQNHKLIKDQKGKGNPQAARTWIYILLDRLLKKQTLEASKANK